MRVALLGTGLLGTGFAEGMLLRGGVDLSVWNRSSDKTARLRDKGARVAETPADAVQGAERVHLVLLDDDVVDETIEALRPGLDRSAVILDHTTTLPSRTADRAERLSAEGIGYLHCPVFMSPTAARGAAGLMLVCGPSLFYERVLEGVKRMTGDVWYVGERPDLAACYKLFGNTMILTITGGLADVFHLADALDVPRADAFGLFSRFKPEAGMATRGAKMVEENYTPSFTSTVARKDAGLMLAAGGGAPLPVLRAIAARLDEVIARGDGDQDMSVMARRGG